LPEETREYINTYLSTLVVLAEQIPREDIEKAIELLFDAWRNDAQVFILGNGGSASTATHFACDLSKTTIVGNARRFKVMDLVDNIPLVSAWTNDSGFGSIFAEQLKPWLREGDVVIGISVHGGSGEGEAGPWSQNLMQAVRLAKERKAKVIGFSGFGGGAMKDLADVSIVVPIDQEPLGTPLVESFHVVLHHLVCSALKLKIGREAKGRQATEVVIEQTRLSIVQGDITKQATEAIVNAANPSLMGGGGVDGAIHRAGGRAILEECKQIVSRQGRLPTGKAVITSAGNLKARHVIHTVGPIWGGGSKGEAELLASAYHESLKLATEHNLSSISFPSISTGAYGYPVAEAAKIAIKAVASFLRENPTSLKQVVFVLFDSGTYEAYNYALGEALEAGC
jgi:O-acetyl-ADP-ribose deacetylase (regulator of RNase III)/phosphoheptose isomerase